MKYERMLKDLAESAHAMPHATVTADEEVDLRNIETPSD